MPGGETETRQHRLGVAQLPTPNAEAWRLPSDEAARLVFVHAAHGRRYVAGGHVRAHDACAARRATLIIKAPPKTDSSGSSSRKTPHANPGHQGTSPPPGVPFHLQQQHPS